MFTGPIKTEWLPDGRTMRLLGTTYYKDPKGIYWPAPEGRDVDGASIPQSLWSVIGSPFVGLFRVPSVYHDIACEDRSRSWQETHRMFYHAMLDSGVDETKALVMYVAVYNHGPRWDEDGNDLIVEPPTPDFMNTLEAEFEEGTV